VVADFTICDHVGFFSCPGAADRRATSAFEQQKTGQAATSVTAGWKQVSRSLGIRRTTMVIFADFVLQPGGIVAWIVLGLIAGWLAGKVMSGSGYGLLSDILLGLIGALVGGVVFGFVAGGDIGGGSPTGFWGSLVVAFLGSCLVLVVSRYLGFSRSA
jgi:uncharacterized membrane protein YeaQ/YmgE (transglycosylase-associated protein family)